MWTFAFLVGPNQAHPDIRCLVCGEQEYIYCNVGATMTEHLKVCRGSTPESDHRLAQANAQANDKASKSRKRKFRADHQPPNMDPQVTNCFVRLKNQVDLANNVVGGLNAGNLNDRVGTLQLILSTMGGELAAFLGEEAPAPPQAHPPPQVGVPLPVAPGPHAPPAPLLPQVGVQEHPQAPALALAPVEHALPPQAVVQLQPQAPLQDPQPAELPVPDGALPLDYLDGLEEFVDDLSFLESLDGYGNP